MRTHMSMTSKASLSMFMGMVDSSGLVQSFSRARPCASQDLQNEHSVTFVSLTAPSLLVRAHWAPRRMVPVMTQCHLTTSQNTKHSCARKTHDPSLRHIYASVLATTVVSPGICRMPESPRLSSVDLGQNPGDEHQQRPDTERQALRVQLSAASSYVACGLAQHLHMLSLMRPCAMLTTPPSH